MLSELWAAPLPEDVAKKLDNDIRYLVGQQSSFAEISVAVVDHHGVISQVDSERAYPLASVFKLPLLLAILDAQKSGQFPAMTERLTIGRSDQCIGSGSLARLAVGSQVTVSRAANEMMSVSDNTATDLLFRRFGQAALDEWLHRAGYSSSEILLTNRQAWLLSLGKVPSWGTTTPTERVGRWEALDRRSKLGLAKAIEDGASDLSLASFQAIEDASGSTQSAYEDNLLAARLDNKMSAKDLARMLVDLDSGKLLGSDGRQRALQVLAGQKFHTRLPSRLSRQSQLFHKTGTLSGVRNDAGLLYVNGREDGVAIVFLTQNIKPGAEAKLDRVAGLVAQLVEDAYQR